MSGSQAPRSPEEVRHFFQRWLAASNAGEWVELAEMMHPEIVLVDPMRPEPARGRADAIIRARTQYEPFPDGHAEMVGDPFVALEEPELSYRWRFSGTHTRPIDPPGFAPTGRRVEVEGTSVLRFRDQRVIAATLYFDAAGVARQVRAAPAAGGPLEGLVAMSQRARVKLSRRA